MLVLIGDRVARASQHRIGAAANAGRQNDMNVPVAHMTDAIMADNDLRDVSNLSNPFSPVISEHFS